MGKTPKIRKKKEESLESEIKAENLRQTVFFSFGECLREKTLDPTLGVFLLITTITFSDFGCVSTDDNNHVF